jgi:hypothetical protein
MGERAGGGGGFQGSSNSEDPLTNGRIILKCNFKIVWGYELDVSGIRQVQMAGTCK